ncbi:DUF3783 domain-containing protein [Vallitalea guaymasensis]|uniref:DUF3783 domain-containing protein n=1 Tax=Vallitalea guaymasensis TaxID=1185412 RepID=A0A8J8SAH2_9FIRM|nr:DUF3783 domain-containing protein [Vallitalea guaymasensis]QUH27667.1 DUF3783 domain-containing protein [Vallitalea guaymasensis]
MSFEQINNEDSKRPEGRNCILIYGYNSEEISTIEKFSLGRGIDECVVVTDDMLGNKIKDIIENNIIPVKYKTGIKSKTIVFNALSNKEVHSFINLFKDTGLKKPIYAVATPTSVKWQFGELIKELIKERMSMSKH